MTTIPAVRRPIAPKTPLQARGPVKIVTTTAGGAVGAVAGGAAAGGAWAGVGLAAFGYATAVGRAFIRNAPGWFLVAGVVAVVAGVAGGAYFGGKLGGQAGEKLEGSK